MNSLKKTYGLFYDRSGFSSGLVNWYNQLIDKSYNDLNVADVCKMIRQDILKDIATHKAIDLFLSNPYDGEYDDGGLLNVLVSLDIRNSNAVIVGKLKTMLSDVRQKYTDFEWSDEETKIKYINNVEKMLENLG